MCRVVAVALLAISLPLNSAYAQRGERSESRGEGDGGDNSSRENRRPADDEPPLTPGFGEVSNRATVPGFGISASDAGGLRNQGVPLADRYHPNVVAYVDQVLRRYDRNGNSKLERDEWSAARWRSD